MVSPNTDADNLEKQLREREAAIKELEFENVQMRAAEKVFEQELDLREQKVEKLQQRMREQQSALDRRDKSAGEEVNGILQENERLQLALTAMLEEINGVRQENTAVRQENTSAHKALNQTKAELDNLMRIREDAISSHHTLDQQLLLHRQQIEKMEEERAELHNLKTEFEKKEAEAGRLEDEIARLKDEGVRLTAAAARRLEKAAVTQVDTDALRQHITRKEETIASLREALNKSERVVNAKDHAINKVESLERTRKKELDLAEAECESLRKEKAILDKQHSDSKDDCQRLRDESAILSQKLKNESQYAHQARALRSAPPPPPPAQDNSNLSRCRELVRLTQERVVEEFLMVNANNSGTTLGIAFEDEKGVFKIKHVMMGGPAFLSKQIHKDDILVAINGKKTAGSTGAVVEALTGSNVPGTRVQLTLQKATTGKLQEVSLKRVPTVDLAYRKKLYAVFLDLENEAKKKKDAELVKHVNRCFEMWSMLELDDSVKEGKRERKISDMQEDCEQWLDELNSLLDLGLNLSGDDSPAKEIAQHKKLHSQLKLREKELERELKEVKEAKNSEEREVEAMKREVEAVKVSARSQAEKVILRVSEEAKARLSAAADEIERLGDELQNKQKIYRAQTDELKRYKEEAMTAVRALDGREIELKKLENQLAEAKATLKAQTDELHRYQCEAKAAVRAVDEREMQLKKLERQLVEAKGTTEKVEKDAKSRLDKADALKQTLQRNVDERDRELTKLGEQLQAVRGEVQKSKDSAEAMANQVKSNATVQITETSAELASLYDQMAGLKENDRARADELMRALDHRQEALREVEEKDRLLDRLKNELMNSTDICQKALREVEEKEKLLEKIKKDALQVMEEKEMERKKLKAQLMTLGKVHAQKKVSYDDLLSDIATVEELLEKERQDFKHDLEEGSRLRLDLENEVDRLTTLLKQKELGWESRSKGPLQDRPSFAGERANTNFNLFDTDKVTPAKSKVSPRRAASGSESMEFDDDLLFGMLDMPDRGVLIAPDSNPEQQKALTEALKTANNPRGEITLQKGLALKEGPQKPAKDSSFSLFSALAPGRGLFSSWTSSPSESKAKEDTEHSVGSEFSAPTATTSKDSDSSFMPGRKHRW